MGDNSDIEWTHREGFKGATWEPVLGCEHASPGCKHCYAETLCAVRLGRNPATPRYHGLAIVTEGGAARWARDVINEPVVRLQIDHLGVPLHWRDPRRAFVCSRSDLFHRLVPNEYIAVVHAVMAHCPRSTFLLLTKRADRLPEFYEWWRREAGCRTQLEFARECARHYGIGAVDLMRPSAHSKPIHGAPLPNVHVGVSIESRDYLWRWERLREADVASRWVSLEPLLEDLGDLSPLLTGTRMIDWAVIGGESGKGARRCAVEWIRGATRQLVRAGRPTFVKQLGAVVTIKADEFNDSGFVIGDYDAVLPLKHKKGADVKEWLRMGLGDLCVRETLP